MKTVAPWQLMNFARSVVIFFIVVSVVWIGANYLIIGKFFIGWPVFLGNILVSALGGLWWYKTRHHARFSWDGEGCELQKGRTPPIVKRWDDISQVSLVHEGYGRFAVRLYPQEGNSVDIPASDLGLKPADFRFEVIDLVRAKA